MKIIEQGFEVLGLPNRLDTLSVIEHAGRTAYKSERDLTEASASVFASMLISRGHLSVIEHMSASIRFITDRGVSHELVRHRIASFTQESTRYCNYSKDKFGNEITLIRPTFLAPLLLDIMQQHLDDPLDSQDFSADAKKAWYWLNAMKATEIAYLGLLANGASPQEARSVLPNSLKTEIVVTANLREWRHIFELRAISKAAHPQMRDLMIPVYKHFRKWLPEIFDMGDPE